MKNFFSFFQKKCKKPLPNLNSFDIIHMYTNNHIFVIQLYKNNIRLFGKQIIKKVPEAKMNKIRIISALLLAAAVLLGTSGNAGATDGDMLDKVVFFGDSTTAHLAVRGGIPRERVWSGEGSTMLFTSVNDKSVKIGDELMSLAEAAHRYRPEILVITVGASGGAGFLNESRFKAIYGKMIDGVRIASPGTKVIVQSIYPLSDKSVKYYKKLTKQAVADANEWIRDVCRERGVPYLDVHSLLAGDDGYLRPEYQNDEYLHLTAAAYAVILNNLRSYLVMHKDTYT